MGRAGAQPDAGPYLRFGKRAVDVSAALALLCLCVPLLLLLSLGAWARHGRPFFADRRVGRGGRPFTCYKICTMRGDGDTSTDAARLTAYGRFLRAHGLDETPQLWHVLRGQMSLVGPRPLPPRYLPLLTERQKRRHAVRPGLTGWAQVAGRNTLDWPQRLELDVRYVRRVTLGRDLRILCRTVGVVLRGAGAQSPGHAAGRPLTAADRLPMLTGSL